MAAKQQKLTCTLFIGGKQVDKLTPEQLDRMVERLGEAMSTYYTQNISEYLKIKGGNSVTNERT